MYVVCIYVNCLKSDDHFLVVLSLLVLTGNNIDAAIAYLQLVVACSEKLVLFWVVFLKLNEVESKLGHVLVSHHVEILIVFVIFNLEDAINLKELVKIFFFLALHINP